MRVTNKLNVSMSYYYYYYSSYISKFKAKNFFVWKEPPLLPSNAGKILAQPQLIALVFSWLALPRLFPKCV